MRVTLRPRDSRIAARDADAMPLPSEDTTPPVTKTNLVMERASVLQGPGVGRTDALVVKRDYTGRLRRPPDAPGCPRAGLGHGAQQIQHERRRRRGAFHG